MATAVLGSPDPRYELPGDERWYAPVRGQMPEHSEYLRTGLSETMMALAIFDPLPKLAGAPQTVASVRARAPLIRPKRRREAPGPFCARDRPTPTRVPVAR